MGAHTINKCGMPFMFDLNILDTAEFGVIFTNSLCSKLLGHKNFQSLLYSLISLVQCDPFSFLAHIMADSPLTLNMWQNFSM
jgi:hypothetical protein